MNRFQLHRIMAIRFLLLSICLFSNCYQPQKSQGEKNADLMVQLLIANIYIFPSLDFNQFCPPTDQIPVLEPGNHSIYLEAGQSYIFDNRARLNMQNFTSATSKFFTFSFQENAGQEINLVSPWCGQSASVFPSNDDTGLEAQLETVYISQYSPRNNRRYGFFTKFIAIKGSGTINFTTPSTFDPPR